ncbi:MAG TPA: cobalamin biosynthesis protein, partial [Bacillota bacterium]|nr:cobalamin biosynthesis protein [Bacillota bacterium]
MRLAVVALTREGSKLGQRIAALPLGGPGAMPDLYLPTRFATSGAIAFQEPLRDLTVKLLEKYQGIIFIMALGIVVRMIAPCLKDKRYDPAILCADEDGRFIISVAAGHLGGANDLSVRLAEYLAATPVITSATDVRGRVAFDVLARDRGLALDTIEQVKLLNAAVVNGERIGFFTDISPEALGIDTQSRLWEGVEVMDLDQLALKGDGFPNLVLVTSLASAANRVRARADVPVLYLRPRRIIAGIGCRRGVSAEAVIEALREAFLEAGRSIHSLKKLASVDIKADEQGLLAAAVALQVPIEFFSGQRLSELLVEQPDLTQSEFVKSQIGVAVVALTREGSKLGQR